MSALAITAPQAGLARSAQLMRALGPDAAAIWAELTPIEVQALSRAMDALGDDASPDDSAVRSFMEAHRRLSASVSPTGSIWSQVSALSTDALIAVTAGEHPQTVALILSHLTGDAAARLLRGLAPPLAIDAMHRLLHLGTPHRLALASLEAHLAAAISTMSGAGTRGGHERVARIFDRLDSRSETIFLAALENVEPGAGERVRALMFTFDDLATLDAGGVQTLLSAADRATLVIALKGASEATANAFFGNMTQRASAMLKDEIANLGPMRRADVEAARLELVTLARTLINRGDIRSGMPIDEDELVE